MKKSDWQVNGIKQFLKTLKQEISAKFKVYLVLDSRFHCHPDNDLADVLGTEFTVSIVIDDKVGAGLADSVF